MISRINLFEKFYKNRKVLITGHTGFKGSWLALWLYKLGANIIGIALDPYTEFDNFVLSGLHDKITDLRVDIRDYQAVEGVFGKYEPEIVFHLAAQPLVRVSYEVPRETFETNVMGMVNLLEAFRRSDSACLFVGVTSDKCYENKGWVWGYRESDRLGGRDPYSASKGVQEIIAKSYSESFFKGRNRYKVVATARAGNVLGGGDWSRDRLIPDCVKAFERGEPVCLRNPKAVRPWQHVLEPLGGYLLLGIRLFEEPDKYEGAWNFGPYLQSVLTVENLVKLFIAHYGNGAYEARREESDDLHEAMLLSLDISKAKFLLGWEPVLDINETIALTAGWYRAYRCRDCFVMALEQIEYFEKKAFYLWG